ncbi:unnamed protein product [Vitrella brassicaformis CCMP3155]|uniref:VOC domain-containing protein n=1 Tax=Vitrella brassicaformis (strain CCMP3155) TaxID=1169540 RepID=A0A0G4H743_VITBC|nr:unnamed protein product [Vitrella brassicaformis CCMP3155]|eukprot:CEM39698.1 unnamed protein product [Vitrella brassicaformis CCMP3155]
MVNHGLNHFTIATPDLKSNIEFYRDVLGLVHGPPLSNTSPGAYMYLPGTDTQPVVHMIDSSKWKDDNNLDFRLDAKPSEPLVADGRAGHRTGGLEHIAFVLDAEDFAPMKQRLVSMSIEHVEGNDNAPQVRQLWFFDPQGIKLELNFVAQDK